MHVRSKRRVLSQLYEMVRLPPIYYVRYCRTSKASNAGSNAYVQIPSLKKNQNAPTPSGQPPVSCLAVNRALFEVFFCHYQKYPAAVSQIYF